MNEISTTISIIIEATKININSKEKTNIKITLKNQLTTLNKTNKEKKNKIIIKK